MLNAPNVTGNRIRAYLSILLVPDPEGGGAAGVIFADNFPEAPMVLTVVLIRSSFDPNTWCVEEACWDIYPVLLGEEGGADGSTLAADIVSSAFARLNGFGLEAKEDCCVTPEDPWTSVEGLLEWSSPSVLLPISDSE